MGGADGIVRASFGFDEIFLVLVVALVVFGGELPSVLRSIGRAYMRMKLAFQRMRDEVVSQIDLESEEPAKPAPVQSEDKKS